MAEVGIENAVRHARRIAADDIDSRAI